MSNDDRELQFCVGCRAQAPETNTEYTLISSRFGWRLTRATRAGAFVMEWRCPACWQRYKAERQLAMTPTDGLPAYSGDLPAATPRRSPEVPGDTPASPSSRKR